MAERVGFEPTDRLPGQRFSRSLGINEPEHSATRNDTGFKHLASSALRWLVAQSCLLSRASALNLH